MSFKKIYFTGVNTEEINSGGSPRSVQLGKCLSNTAVRFVVGPNSSIVLVGKAKWYVYFSFICFIN